MLFVINFLCLNSKLFFDIIFLLYKQQKGFILKITVAISGASGSNLGLNFIRKIPDNIEVFLVVSNSAKTALKLETGLSLRKELEQRDNVTIFDDSNIAAPIASGSFQVDKMIVIPCSMNTLAKCSVGISDSLITRAFTVMLKERREIILCPREMPFNPIALENMLKLSKLGVTIAPPVLGYYSEQKSLEDMENFLIGKWFDLLKIEHNLFKRWE